MACSQRSVFAPAMAREVLGFIMEARRVVGGMRSLVVAYRAVVSFLSVATTLSIDAIRMIDFSWMMMFLVFILTGIQRAK